MKWGNLATEVVGFALIGAFAAFVVHPSALRGVIGAAVGASVGVFRYFHLKHRKDKA